MVLQKPNADEEKHEWDRQPRETSRSYELFCVYRNLGAERSLAKARGSAEGIPSVARLKVLSRKWNWVERCQKYDDYLEYQDRLQQEKERREMHKRHAKMGMLAQTFAVRKLEKMAGRIEQDEERVSPGEVARILDVGVKVERLARGEPTDSHEVMGPGGGPMKLDLEETLKRIDEVYGLKTEDGTGKTRGPGDGSGTPEP
jgi:hypothetical protein